MLTAWDLAGMNWPFNKNNKARAGSIPVGTEEIKVDKVPLILNWKNKRERKRKSRTNWIGVTLLKEPRYKWVCDSLIRKKDV